MAAVNLESRPAVPKITTMEDNGTKVHSLVLIGHQLKVSEKTKAVGISKDCVGHILNEMYDVRQLSAR